MAKSKAETHLVKPAWMPEIGALLFMGSRDPRDRRQIYSLQDTPYHTVWENKDDYVLHGWRGVCNNVVQRAHGVVRVTEHRGSEWVKVTCLTGDDERDALAEMGYPDLFYDRHPVGWDIAG